MVTGVVGGLLTGGVITGGFITITGICFSGYIVRDFDPVGQIAKV
jgi:hypothetical protein